MDSDSERESIEGDVEAPDKSTADWGKAKFDYYYTDYVDKDYPSKLTAKEERLASIEQEEALRIQKKLLSTLEDVDLQVAYEIESDSQEPSCPSAKSICNLIEIIEAQNKSYASFSKDTGMKKRKRVHFVDQSGSEVGSMDEADMDDDNVDQGDEDGSASEVDDEDEADGETLGCDRQRRPINVAIKKNRGLTPYKKKEYRNPRVKHKLKYKKAMSKRRRIVREAMPQLQRYSGEATGIKTSTIKSIKLN